MVGGLNANPTGSPTPNLQFVPNQVAANINDVVVFMFLASEHNVVQTPFATPCVPIQNGKSIALLVVLRKLIESQVSCLLRNQIQETTIRDQQYHSPSQLQLQFVRPSVATPQPFFFSRLTVRLF
jgi:hypothetical protein